MDAGLAQLVSWSEQTRGDVPPPLTGPSITISPLGAPHPPTIFLFGGKSVQTRRLTSEMWAMDVASRVWEKIDAGVGPGPRYFHSMDVWEDKLVCFGGMSDSDPMSVHSDIWFFDCLSRRWIPQSGPSSGVLEQDPAHLPSARYAHLSAVSNGKLVISGGQHSDNSWIYEINVFDLRRKVWESKTEQPEMQGQHSKGAYRSVTASAKQRVIEPPAGAELKTVQTYSIDEEGEGGDIYCYSNYDFAKVRRELDIISADVSVQSAPSDKHIAPASFSIRDDSGNMRGASQPPGLRFPTGGIVGNHFILCGLYLASSSAAFSIWALNLKTMLWKHLEPQVLGTGSWNRAVIWPEQAKIIVFGNTSHDLTSDYSRRAVNLDNVAVISLEAFGIYQPPKLEIPATSQQVGLSMLDEKLASDFDVISDDGRRIKCSRRILSDRWRWFAEQERDLADRLGGIVRDQPALDINDTLLGSFTPARLTPSTLTIPEPFPVCVALVQYFYTLSLSTPLQNRAPVLSALLFIAKQYRIERLAKLVLHALHERLEPAIAVGVYEIATLAGEQYLQVRALNMIHAAKASSSRTQSHKQGPSSAPAGEPGTTSTPSNAPTTSGSLPSTASTAGGLSGGPIDGLPYRRARADSVTVPMEIITAKPAEELDRQTTVDTGPDQVNELLAALDVQDLPRRKSSIPSLNPSVTSSSIRIPARHIPPITPAAPPSADSPSIPQTPDFSHHPYSNHRPSSPTNSDVTSNFPSTPADTVRDSWLLPPSACMDSRSSSSSGHGHGYGYSAGLKTLPEAEAFSSVKLRHTNRDAKREAVIDGSMSKQLDPATLEAAGLITLNSPPRSLRRKDVHGDLNSRFESVAIAHDRLHDKQCGFSVNSESSGTTSQHCAEMSYAVPGIRTSTDSDFTLRSKSSLGGVRSIASGFTGPSDTFSINSGSTGTSSKKTAKAELKAIREAEEHSKKAEAQAKFEALRAKQAHKMALDKAEAQRRAEIAKNAPVAGKKKEQPKSKWGKLGQGFADAVLFPSGNGEKTTIF